MRRLASCYFSTITDPVAAARWTRMARVLYRTAQAHCQGWDVQVQKIEPEPVRSARGSRGNVANTQKLDHWASVVDVADIGDEVLLIDADTFLVRSLDEVFTHPFDLAYTVRGQGAMFPINAGVIFLRVSARTRAFMDAWAESNRSMLADAKYHWPWYRKYGGINQAALGLHLEARTAEKLGVDLLALPCEEWNCEDTSWARFDPTRTRVVHVKSALRRRLFGATATTPALDRLVSAWLDIEASVS